MLTTDSFRDLLSKRVHPYVRQTNRTMEPVEDCQRTEAPNHVDPVIVPIKLHDVDTHSEILRLMQIHDHH